METIKIDLDDKDFEKMRGKPLIGSLCFHHFVCDKDGNIEMDIWYEPDARPYKFSVHYPRFECCGAKLRDCTCFQGFTWEQIGMLVYAYSAEEYWKFEKAFCEWSGGNDKSNNRKEVR